jgi:hypothetical protein
MCIARSPRTLGTTCGRDARMEAHPPALARHQLPSLQPSPPRPSPSRLPRPNLTPRQDYDNTELQGGGGGGGRGGGGGEGGGAMAAFVHEMSDPEFNGRLARFRWGGGGGGAARRGPLPVGVLICDGAAA